LKEQWQDAAVRKYYLALTVMATTNEALQPHLYTLVHTLLRIAAIWILFIFIVAPCIS